MPAMRIDVPSPWRSRYLAAAASLVVLLAQVACARAGYITLDPPGSTHTEAETVFGSNVVGFYNDASGTSHAFLYNGTNYTILDPPGSTSSAAYYISGSK